MCPTLLVMAQQVKLGWTSFMLWLILAEPHLQRSCCGSPAPSYSHSQLPTGQGVGLCLMLPQGWAQGPEGRSQASVTLLLELSQEQGERQGERAMEMQTCCKLRVGH